MLHGLRTSSRGRVIGSQQWQHKQAGRIRLDCDNLDLPCEVDTGVSDRTARSEVETQ